MWAKQHRPPKGFTIPEVLISTGILSLVLIACYSLIVFAIKWNEKMTDTVDTYQRAMKASNRINYDLGAGSALTFLYDLDGVDPEGFAVATARPPAGPYKMDPSVSVLMHRWVVYQVINQTLYRNEIPINPPLTRQALMDVTPEPNYVTLVGTLTERGVVVAEEFSNFNIEGGSGAIVSFKVEGNKEDDDGNKVNSIELKSRINFRI